MDTQRSISRGGLVDHLMQVPVVYHLPKRSLKTERSLSKPASVLPLRRQPWTVIWRAWGLLEYPASRIVSVQRVFHAGAHRA